MRLDDLNNLKKSTFIDWSVLNDKTVYVTGATGLIGSSVVKSILYCCNARVVVQVRNESKAKKIFSDKVQYVVADSLSKPKYSGRVDYIIHCANPTSSKFFISNPVETIDIAVNGALNILEFAKDKKVNGFIFLSTMEVYGKPEKGHKVRENECGVFDPSVVRNCYPLSKQVCENLCAAYFGEYQVPTRVVRLTQTFGPGVEYNDARVFAEFARCAIEKRDIILKTKGETERSYLYITDAVSAIISVLLDGEDGEIYTAANESTFCSIYEMALLVSELGKINVTIEEQDISQFGYASTLHMDLDTSKLRNLGWYPQISLKNAYQRMIKDMESQK
ncbi:hypothetical protein B279_07525 [Streptococcus equinus ATCC 33317]|uniref:NAD-dependent epimerase/dehydratase family protein n=1 Tax=Streptococcus TaxID=1301 RepID=UPI00050755A0|nr:MULTISPECIES: NAD-dependent epimerase/dehydratase family protein [Streptococcus]KFN85829.1 hypothetical protein B279_07525 [Streptococcus equinus ATCC 33317]MBM6697767.1 NAD-dependent epimerase/dehydratase family protein [Streptococcus alactolyticus]